MSHSNEQDLIRQAEVQQLRELGVNPYPTELKSPNYQSDIKRVLALYTANPEHAELEKLTLAGRLITKRIQGKSTFLILQGENERLQLYVNRDELCPGEDKTLYNTIVKKLLSNGDIIGVSGYMFTTKTGESTLRVQSLEILSKCLHPIPTPKEVDGEIHDAFTDSEQRYRHRYLDLFVNPEVKEVFRTRANIITTIRDSFNRLDALEVETPILQPLYGGAAARPFVTHHNTLDQDLYLRIANELYLKRLIVGGFPAVYEFAKDFRNEGMSRFHNPEFTQVELYVAYQDYNFLMSLVEDICSEIVVGINGSYHTQPDGSRTFLLGDSIISYQGQSIDFSQPWQRYTFYESLQVLGGLTVDVANSNLEELIAIAHTNGVSVENDSNRIQVLDALFSQLVEPQLIQPTFITDYPREMSPLAKTHRTNPDLVERFEGYIGGKEICNAYTELNDPVDQRQRLEEQARLRAAGDEDAMVVDEDFLLALEYGMPPTAGLGIGIDRLTMIMTDSYSIKDVIFFPQMKVKK